MFVFFCLSTLPISMSWPHTIADVAQLGRDLHGYSQSGPGPLSHVMAVMAISAIWKHAWSIPGSVLWVRISYLIFFNLDLIFPECPWWSFILPRICDSYAHRAHHNWFSMCYAPLDSSRSLLDAHVSSGTGPHPQCIGCRVSSQ